MNLREKLTVFGWFSLGLNIWVWLNIWFSLSLIDFAEKSLDWYADLELMRAHRDGDFECLVKKDALPVC